MEAKSIETFIFHLKNETLDLYSLLCGGDELVMKYILPGVLIAVFCLFMSLFFMNWLLHDSG